MKHAALSSVLVAAVSSVAFAESRESAIDQVDPIENEVPEAIVGGTVVADGAWPDAVSLADGVGPGACTGTLIAPTVILTAGHCEEAGLEAAVIGTTNFKADAGQEIRIRSVTPYPQWLDTYDVSVIVLEQPVQGVQPRKVASECTFNSGWTNSSMVKVVGFGATTRDADDNNSILREVAVPLTDATCSDGNGCNPAVSPNGEFTAGGNNLDSCNGDSGGPVYLQTPRGAVLVGVVSRAVNESASACGDGGIYVRADKVVNWIEQTTGVQIEQDDCGGGGGDPDGKGGDPDDKDGTGDDKASDAGGGCSTGGHTNALAVIGLLALVKALRRRAV